MNSLRKYLPFFVYRTLIRHIDFKLESTCHSCVIFLRFCRKSLTFKSSFNILLGYYDTLSSIVKYTVHIYMDSRLPDMHSGRGGTQGNGGLTEGQAGPVEDEKESPPDERGNLSL